MEHENIRWILIPQGGLKVPCKLLKKLLNIAIIQINLDEKFCNGTMFVYLMSKPFNVGFQTTICQHVHQFIYNKLHYLI